MPSYVERVACSAQVGSRCAEVHRARHGNVQFDELLDCGQGDAAAPRAAAHSYLPRHRAGLVRTPIRSCVLLSVDACWFAIFPCSPFLS
jgi:hypothetical protein